MQNQPWVRKKNAEPLINQSLSVNVSAAELGTVSHAHHYPAHTCGFSFVFSLVHQSMPVCMRGRNVPKLINLFFFLSTSQRRTKKGNIFQTEQKQENVKKTNKEAAAAVGFFWGFFQYTKSKLDEWRLESRKRRFGNNPSAAVPSDGLIGWVRKREVIRLTERFRFFHFDEGEGVIMAMK